MGIDQALGDTAAALAFARATRTVTDHEPGRLVLGGFSVASPSCDQLAASFAPEEKGPS
jgi:hypothetical protein